MTLAIPRFADVNDVVDTALKAYAKDIPVSLANLMPAVRWRLAGLDICEERLTERVRERAAELDVTLID